jgi:hypothetical protein
MKIATKKFIVLMLFILYGTVMIFVAIPVSADQALWDMQGELDEVSQAYNQHQNQPVDIRTMTINIIKVFLSLVALIDIIFIIYGGFRWMTAGANEENVKQAKHTIKSAIYGLAIIMLSYAIVTFLVGLAEDDFFDQF